MKFPVITGRTHVPSVPNSSATYLGGQNGQKTGFVWTDYYYCERESQKQWFRNSGKPQNPKPFPIFA